jgi:hypothetical protein
MPGLVPGIHELGRNKDVDGRDKPGHDNDESSGQQQLDFADAVAVVANGIDVPQPGKIP